MENRSLAPRKRFASAETRDGGTTMSTPMRTRGTLLLPILAALLLALMVSPTTSVQAQGPTTFTSPIDATGLTLQIQASVPDRDSGQPINIPVPPAVLPADVAQLLSSPLSSQ